MLFDFVNFLLVFSVSINITLMWLLLRQNAKMPVVYMYAVIILLFVLDMLGMLYILNAGTPGRILLVSKFHFAFSFIIFATLYYFASIFTYSRNLPRIQLKHVAVFLMAALLSGGYFQNLMAADIQWNNGIYFPVHATYYWLPVVYFMLIGLLTAYEIYNRYRISGANWEVPHLKPISAIVFPITAASLFAIYILPFFVAAAPVFFAGYVFISLLFFISAERFQILEITERTQYLLPQLGTSGFFMLIFYYLFKETSGLELQIVYGMIPFLLACAGIGYYITLIFTRVFKKVQLGFDERLDTSIEQFSTDIVKFMEPRPLWEYVANFCKDTFNVTKVAIITMAYDISPYQIAHLEGYDEEKITSLLDGNSPLINRMEESHRILNKFDYSNKEPLFQIMEHYHLYLGIPLIRKGDMMGIIFLGGERQYTPILRRHIHVVKLISSQVVIAEENIGAIHKMVQSQKMADLGLLASQVAHDFRSFIALSRMYNKDNQPLIKEVNFVDKMVRDLLDFAKPPEELEMKPVDIHFLLEKSLTLIQMPADMEVERCFDGDLPKVLMDEGQMQRVFINLMNNGVRAMRTATEKRLRLVTRAIPSLHSDKPFWIYIEIADSGIGIPEEFQERVFEPFFTTHKTEGGNGLGLAIVKQIVTRHSGFIEAASNGQQPGTIFSIRLPHAPA